MNKDSMIGLKPINSINASKAKYMAFGRHTYVIDIDADKPLCIVYK